MARRRTVEERYHYNLRKQRKTLEEFAEYEYVGGFAVLVQD